jgi:ABC-type Fe3+ transport system permease subunit
MFREIMNSVLFAGGASCGVFFLTLLLERMNYLKNKFLQFFSFLPVLIGVRAVSFILLEVFQLPLVNILYGSPVPLLIALILWIFPFIIILQFIPAFSWRNESVHSAELMLSSSRKAAVELLWKMKFSKKLWIMFLVFTLAYFNFTAAVILGPVSMTTVTERLYNLMHYGESERLSAVVCVTMIIPMLLFFIISVIFRSLISRWGRVMK